MAQRTFLQSVVLAGLLTTAFTALPKGSSHPPPENQSQTGSVIPFDEFPRVKFFYHTRHTVSAEGYLLVCPPFDLLGVPIEQPGHEPSCRASNKKNAWITAEDSAPPGFVLAGYSFSYHGSGGSYRNLTLFYRRAAPKP